MDQVPKKEQSSALPSDTTGLPVFNREEFAELLDAVAKTHMPFGKYGPAAYPPDGLPVYELPSEYLQWFSAKGFPDGKLGRLMSTVYQLKCDGADTIFDGFRKAGAGPHLDRKKQRQRNFEFE